MEERKRKLFLNLGNERNVGVIKIELSKGQTGTKIYMCVCVYISTHTQHAFSYDPLKFKIL